jgi:hypothetical protein
MFWIVAALAMWRFGFWWGIVMSVAAFALSAVIEGLNVAAAAEANALELPRRSPPLARLHAAITAFIAGFLGFAMAAVVGVATYSGAVAIIAAAAACAAIGAALEWLLEMDWRQALGSWFLLFNDHVPRADPARGVHSAGIRRARLDSERADRASCWRFGVGGVARIAVATPLADVVSSLQPWPSTAG